MSEKIIRDPVHDVIAFRTERAADGLLFRLVNAAEFQRLRRVRQLGMASLAYPGADHSRYSHSLGVMETARQMLEQIGKSVRLDPQAELVCVVSALLHDLGHGPFSHVFERVTGIHHEDLTRRVIANPDSEVFRQLSDFDRALPGRVIAFMAGSGDAAGGGGGTGRNDGRGSDGGGDNGGSGRGGAGSGGGASGGGGRSFYSDILSSQLDADRFDYLLRDNLMTGSRYGGFDLQWLLHALVVDDDTNRLAVTLKGISAAEGYLQSRFHMYRNVYFHKVVRSAEGMLKLALQRARRLAVQRRLAWPPVDHPVTKALLGQRLEMPEFNDLDDVSVMHCFKVWANADDPVLAGLCRGLLFRRVYKTIDLSHHADPLTARAAVTAVERAIAGAGGEPGYEMFYDQPEDTPYETFENDGVGANEILIRTADGRLTPFATLSPMSRALNVQLMFRRLHVSPQYRDLAEGAVRGS